VIRADQPPKKSIWAAGSVVVDVDGDEPRFLIVHRPRYKDWSLPKGKLNRGEPFLDAAIRETREETGILGKRARPVGTVGYLTKAGNPKVVKWWLTVPKKGKFKKNSEVDQVMWATFDEANATLQYSNDKTVLDRANDMVWERSAGSVHLVRHATAGTRDRSDPEDDNRSIDDRGIRQRRAIRNTLLGFPVTRIGSSQFNRCVQTVQEISDTTGIPVEREMGLADGAHKDRLVALIHELQQEAAVLCTHGDIIASLVGRLFAEGVAMEGPMEWEKGSMWHLRTIEGRVVSGSYVPPAD
jgi:8-oxo-dGTP diphosphatase